MALTLKGIEAMASLPKIKKVVSFGYPIILTPPAIIENLFKVNITAGELLSVSQAQRIRRVHGTEKPQFVAIDKLYNKLGAEFHAIDIVRPYNCEILHDLNVDFCDKLMAEVGDADLCIDPGTIEHVFHVSKAFLSLYSLAKVGGHILHINAPIAPNHGLYNPQEKLYLKFYTANRADIIFAEKYFTNSADVKTPFIAKRWRLKEPSELRGTVFVKKTNNNEIVLPKDYLT